MGKRKKIFITGAAGMVGSALRRYLRGRYDFRTLPGFPGRPGASCGSDALRRGVPRPAPPKVSETADG
jgi:nucleoside-diphosphate-sugar epimerase